MSSRPPRFEAAVVEAVAADALGAGVAWARHLAVGWGNENWRVRTVTGDDFVLKLGPPESGPKWQATRGAYAVAAARGVPVNELVHFDPSCAAAGGWVVRILRWVDGVEPAPVLSDPAHCRRFFTSLGVAVRSLHEHPVDGFCSRLDGSKPSFGRWDDYVAFRWSEVRARVEAAAAFGEAEISDLERELAESAAAVADVVRPALCHRDLHLGNLLATPDGGLAAVLDFDGAEAWDPAIDVVKLRWLVFPHQPGAAEAFAAGYGEPPARWDERVRLVDVLELTNTVANAVATQDESFERSARQRLAEVRSER
jgi:aminoglycoside phosphotransferase (APT) family kinase protein